MTDTHPLSTSPSSKAQPALDRRSFLAGSAGAAWLAAVGGSAGAQPRAASGPIHGRGHEATNLIMMVADGMSIGTFQLAHRYAELTRGRGSQWADLMNRPGVRNTLALTRSANSEVTDSAGASSAWSIGQTVNNGAICVTPDGLGHEPLFQRARRSGRAVGLVSTTNLYDATPAGFAAVAPSRGDSEAISRQLIDQGISVLLGGGGLRLREAIARNGEGPPPLASRDELLTYRPDPAAPLIGTFADRKMDYEVDRRQPDSGSSPTQPSLAEMTTAALARLDRDPRGAFALQIEGARIDHAAHACDAAALLADQIAFDEALTVVLNWLGDRDDTLLIVTTDHGNAAPTVTGTREPRFEALDRATGSFSRLFEAISAMEDGKRTPAALGELVHRYTGFDLEPDERQTLARALAGEPVNAYAGLRSAPLALGTILSNHHAVSFVSGQHTAEPVLVTALGPGSERIPAFGHLTDTHHAMVAALGLPEPRAV